jgi:LysR family pca operon transcriptional activator
VLARTDHPIFAVEALTSADLRHYDLVLPTVTQRVGQEIDHLLDTLGLTGRAMFRSSSYGFIREMLHGSDALSLMPRLMMVGDLLRGTLRVVPLPIATPDRPAGLILPRDRVLPPAGQALVACLRAYVAEIAARGLSDITSSNSSARRSDTTDATDAP